MISIIIPVYNAERYLNRCIDSVISQEYADWELILVDDGSTDSSGVICDKYALIDTRIHVIHHKNQGVSAARNEGLKDAKGSYIVFIDADDYAASSYLQSLITHIGDADLCINGIVGYDRYHNERFKDFFQTDMIACSNFSYEMQKKLFLYNGPYCKLFRRHIIQDHKLSFPVDLSYGEDALFFYSYLLHCRTISFTDNIGYIYTVSCVDSLSSVVHSPWSLWLLHHQKYRLFEELMMVFPHRYSESDIVKLGHIKTLVWNMSITHMDYKSRMELVNSILTDSNFGFRHIRCKSMKDYLFCYCLRKNNRLSLYLLSLLFVLR